MEAKGILVARLLNLLYHNARYTASELSQKLGLSYYETLKLIEECEKNYGLAYVTNVDPSRLGFTGSKVVAIKFGKRPSINTIKREFCDDVFVQAAYLCKGGFDLLLYVVGTNEGEYGRWEWTLRALISKYKAVIFSSSVDWLLIGFLPLSTEMIKISKELSDREKRVLTILNENARIKIKGISDKTGLSHFQVVNTIEKLKKKKIIQFFSALVQKPEKNVNTATFFQFLSPSPKHLAYLKKIIEVLLKENFSGPTSDYAILYDLTGQFDMLAICNYRNWDDNFKRGSALWVKLCKDENIITKEATLVELIKGKWPFHADRYEYHKYLSRTINKTENIYKKMRDYLKAGKSSNEVLWERDPWDFSD